MGTILRRAGLAAAALAGAAIVSCGPTAGQRLPETGATLEGTITYGSEPVSIAMVIVTGPGGSATGQAEEGGHYKVENVPLGEVKVGVNTSAAKGQYMSQAMAASYKGPDGKGSGKAPKFLDVPAQYGSPEKSGFTTTVGKGVNRFDITIPK